jgi:hypothetical protein
MNDEDVDDELLNEIINRITQKIQVMSDTVVSIKEKLDVLLKEVIKQ